MRAKKIFKFFVIAVLSLIVGVFCLFILFAVALSKSYYWDRDQWNQRRIAEAYLSYYKSQTNCPENIGDLVNKGYLPSKASWYKEPPGFFNRVIDFEKGDYVVLPATSNRVYKATLIGRKTHQSFTNLDFSSPENRDLANTLSKIMTQNAK